METACSEIGNGRASSGSLRRSLNRLAMLRTYMTIAPKTDIVTMLAVSDCPPNLTSSSLKIAAMPTAPPARMATCGVPRRGWMRPRIAGR